MVTKALAAATYANFVAGDKMDVTGSYTNQTPANNGGLDFEIVGNDLTYELVDGTDIIVTLTGITTVNDAGGVFTFG